MRKVAKPAYSFGDAAGLICACILPQISIEQLRDVITDYSIKQALLFIYMFVFIYHFMWK